MSRLHDNDLDRLFADKLEDLMVEPPERAWKKVAAGITIAAPFTAAALSQLARPFIWSFTLLSTAFLLTVSDQPKQTSSVAIPTDVKHISQGSWKKSSPTQPPSLASLVTPVFVTNNVSPSPDPFYLENPVENAVTLPNNVIEPQTTQIPSAPGILSSIVPTDLKVPLPSCNPSSLSSEQSLLQANSVIPAWLDMSYESGMDVFMVNDRMNSSWRSTALNNGIGLSFHFSDFYLRSGIGLMNISHANSYQYSVNEYQQTGEMTMVDSVSFIQGIDTAGQPILIPQYYTSIHPIYDSVEVQKSIESPDKYRYAEIPISLGFRKSVGRFSLYAQSGFTYSFLINSKLLTRDDFSQLHPDDVLSWQSQALRPVENFWSFSLAAGCYYQTNRGISFGIEPTYRYCLDPVFTTGELESIKPVSYGLRLRLIYEF